MFIWHAWWRTLSELIQIQSFDFLVKIVFVKSISRLENEVRQKDLWNPTSSSSWTLLTRKKFGAALQKSYFDFVVISHILKWMTEKSKNKWVIEGHWFSLKILKGWLFFRRILSIFGQKWITFKMKLWHPGALYGLHIVFSRGYGLETRYVYGCLTIWFVADKRNTFVQLLTYFLVKNSKFLRCACCPHTHFFLFSGSNWTSWDVEPFWCKLWTLVLHGKI